MKRQKYICRACSSLLFKIFPARGSKLKHLKFSPQSHFLFSAPLPFKRGAFYGISVWIFKNVSKHLSKSLNCGFSTTLIKVLLTFKVRTDNTGITPLLLFGFLSYQQSEIKKSIWLICWMLCWMSSRLKMKTPETFKWTLFWSIHTAVIYLL